MKQRIAFAMIMGIITTGIISFTLISINLGYTSKFFQIWLRSWGMAYLVVIPAILVIGPIVKKFVMIFFADKKTSDEAFTRKNNN